jgi:hypothetical protein
MERRLSIVEPDPGHTKLAVTRSGLNAIARITNPIAVVAVRVSKLLILFLQMLLQSLFPFWIELEIYSKWFHIFADTRSFWCFKKYVNLVLGACDTKCGGSRKSGFLNILAFS